MSDAFLPGNGFDTYETQDKVLVSMDGTVDCGVVVRILQQQGFGVAEAEPMNRLTKQATSSRPIIKGMPVKPMFFRPSAPGSL